MKSRASATLLASLAMAGCVGPQTTLQSARTLEPGKVELVAGGSIPVHASFSSAIIDTADGVIDRVDEDPTAELSTEEKQQLIEAALAVALFQLGPARVVSARPTRTCRK